MATHKPFRTREKIGVAPLSLDPYRALIVAVLHRAIDDARGICPSPSTRPVAALQ